MSEACDFKLRDAVMRFPIVWKEVKSMFYIKLPREMRRDFLSDYRMP